MKYKLIKNDGKYLNITVLNNNKKDENLSDFFNSTICSFTDRVKELFVKVLNGEQKEIDGIFNETIITINSEVTRIQEFEFEEGKFYIDFIVNTKTLYKLILKYIQMIKIERIKYKIKINKILTIELCTTLILIVITFLIGIYYKNYGLTGFFCAVIATLVTQIMKILKNKISIIKLYDCMILSKKYMSWEQARKKYSDRIIYSSSPMTYEEVVSWFKGEFGTEEKWPFSKICIINFYKSDKKSIKANLK